MRQNNDRRQNDELYDEGIVVAEWWHGMRHFRDVRTEHCDVLTFERTPRRGADLDTWHLAVNVTADGYAARFASRRLAAR